MGNKVTTSEIWIVPRKLLTYESIYNVKCSIKVVLIINDVVMLSVLHN